MSLQPVLVILNELAATTKKNEKISILEKYKNDELFKRVVFYAFDPFKRYKTTEIEFIDPKSIKLITNLRQTNTEIFKFLDFLANRTGCTKDENRELSEISSIDQETITVVNRILNKDLRVGCSKKTFKKIFTDMPYFEIMTCKDSIPKFLDFIRKQKLINSGIKPTKKNIPNISIKGEVFGSLKKDGCRTCNIVYPREILHISRKGLHYPNFDIFNDDLRLIADFLHKKYKLEYPIYIDGEAMDSSGSFNALMSQIRNLKTIDDSKFQFEVFDIALNDNTPFKSRYHMLVDAFEHLNGSLKKIHLLEHTLLDYEHEYQFRGFMNWAVEIENEEGAVFKWAESPYELKEKSWYWCKAKPTDTLDLQVIDIYMGTEGKKHDGRIGGFVCLYKGKKVRVGSGYSDKERELFLNPENRPQIIEVKIKEITPGGSLREPRFFRPRWDKDTVDGEEE